MDDGKILTKSSPDGSYTMTYRITSTYPAKEPFTKINATIDVVEYGPGGRKITDYEIKFAE